VRREKDAKKRRGNDRFGIHPWDPEETRMSWTAIWVDSNWGGEKPGGGKKRNMGLPRAGGLPGKSARGTYPLQTGFKNAKLKGTKIEHIWDGDDTKCVDKGKSRRKTSKPRSRGRS